MDRAGSDLDGIKESLVNSFPEAQVNFCWCVGIKLTTSNSRSILERVM